MNEAAPLDSSRPKQTQNSQPTPQTPVVKTSASRPRPPVAAAILELRHKLILLSFIIIVVFPALVSAGYLWVRAEDQYISTIAFSVRKEEGSPSVDILGGITQLTGGTTASDTDIIYAFLRSEDIVAKIDSAIDLRSRFAKAWPSDFVFSFQPSGSIEQLARYWRRQVHVLYDTSTRLITIEVAAFTRQDAYEIARETFEESSRTINRLSDIAREDATRSARNELNRSHERLTEARQALTAFRMRTQIVDPLVDLAGQMGVLNSLQTQLAEALISLHTLRENARPDDQRVIQAEQRINAIRFWIAEERAKFGAAGDGPSGQNYAQLVAEYEQLSADMEFAETGFRSAQASYDLANVEAQRQSRYLAAHIEPKLAESSIAPNRSRLLFSALGILMLIWSIGLLIYYSIRDRR